MKPISRRRQRTFSLQISLPPLLDDYAWDVINSIEQTTLMVVDPHNRTALDAVTDSSGAFLVDSDATLAVPLADWLAVGCQRIRWEKETEDELPVGACGMYHSNFDTAFGRPFDEVEPLGPSAYVGQIVLPREIHRAWCECLNSKEATAFVETVQFIVAHELVHVFDNLKYLVPAFMDWRAFRMNIGSSMDILYSRMCDKSSFVDHYGEQHELECIQHWWPSRADKWFRTRDYDWSMLSKKARAT